MTKNKQLLGQFPWEVGDIMEVFDESCSYYYEILEVDKGYAMRARLMDIEELRDRIYFGK